MTALPITRRVIDELATARRAQKVSALEMANRMTGLGYPIKRSVIANCETGRRAEISVDHMVFAARSLELSPATLLVRCGVAKCPTCNGAPPAGFTCNVCGGTA
ncbi:hypothetical protein Q5762_07275 [Streptomyces sp. P9(2023)]|uniref:hypothetical protein n=1 Tax=Streptomyces sp. P9(2023) TaxID=3064394 RepID=UPI0028F4537F|nr:hypothetical protein [Streptomyces sp. P9(2023)]MDT9688157.1 hypothetical protein [Streptomyces sp. P9(2023)]